MTLFLINHVAALLRRCESAHILSSLLPDLSLRISGNERKSQNYLLQQRDQISNNTFVHIRQEWDGSVKRNMQWLQQQSRMNSTFYRRDIRIKVALSMKSPFHVSELFFMVCQLQELHFIEKKSICQTRLMKRPISSSYFFLVPSNEYRTSDCRDCNLRNLLSVSPFSISFSTDHCLGVMQ